MKKLILVILFLSVPAQLCAQSGLYVDNTGNVGVGVDDPQVELDVAGDAVISGVVGVGTDDPQAELDIAGDAIISGVVGIGTDDPQAELDVVGDAIINNTLAVGLTTPDTPFHVYHSSPAEFITRTATIESTKSAILELTSTLSDDDGRQIIVLTGGSGATTRSIIGFATVNSNTLRLENSVGHLSLIVPGGSNIYASTSITVSSDERLKEEIEPISDSLDKLMKVKPISFNRKGGSRREIGLSAQNIESVFPEMVAVDENGYKAIAYDKVVAPLVKAVQEQQELIESLQREVSALKNGIS